MDSIKSLKIEYNELSEQVREIKFKLRFKSSTLTQLDVDVLTTDLVYLERALNKLHAKLAELD